MASRASHYQAKKRHSQREFTYVKPQLVKEDSWIGEAMEACRILAKIHSNVWGLDEYATFLKLSLPVADERLRRLSKMSFLTTSVERASDGKFIRFTWSLVDPSLPSKRR